MQVHQNVLSGEAQRSPLLGVPPPQNCRQGPKGTHMLHSKSVACRRLQQTDLTGSPPERFPDGSSGRVRKGTSFATKEFHFDAIRQQGIFASPHAR